MRICSIVQRDGESIVLCDGFSWAAFLLGPVWLLWHGMWREAGVFVALGLAAVLVLPAAAWAVVAALHWLLGLEGVQLRLHHLLRNGWRQQAVVTEAEALALRQ